jgi:hypothetical protein
VFTDLKISGNNNVTKKENKHILKYFDHAIYVQPIFKVKIKAISVTTEGTETILLSFTKKLGTLPRKTLRRVVTNQGRTEIYWSPSVGF